MPALAPQARGVDEDEGAVAALEHGVDRVASRAGDLAHNQPLAAKERVDQARLADVRPTENRDADGVVRQRRASGWSETFELLDDAVEQVAASRAVQAGDRDRLAQTEPMQLERERLLARIVDLVREHQNRLVCLAQDLGDLLVPRRHPRPRIDDEEDEIRLP